MDVGCIGKMPPNCDMKAAARPRSEILQIIFAAKDTEQNLRRPAKKLREVEKLTVETRNSRRDAIHRLEGLELMQRAF